MLDSGNAPEAKRRYRTIKSSNYDVNNTCDLACEGCYYFVSDQKTDNRRPSAQDYDAFFRAEAERGINYPVIAGGEPSLNPAALRTAAKYWSSGIIYTNGARRIPDDVPFRIAISVWGAKERNEKLRGANSYERAMATATGDKRAMIYFTVSRDNIDDIEPVVLDCVERGIDVCFQDFSMTTEYMRLLEEQVPPGENRYFRMSTTDNNLSLRMTDRIRAADIIDTMIDRFPERILFNKTVNDWMHRMPAIHTIDPVTNIATDCAMMNAPWHVAYSFDLQPSPGKKCCAPEFDCRDCRVGPVATFTLLAKLTREMRDSPEARARLLDVRDLMMRYHFWDWNVPAAAPAEGDAAERIAA
jgi:MoaA/NifB/PqqE/SkfB family radical SAM enzyme